MRPVLGSQRSPLGLLKPQNKLTTALFLIPYSVKHTVVLKVVYLPSECFMCNKYVNSPDATHHTQTQHIFINVNVTLGPRHSNATGGVRSSCSPIYAIDSVLRTQHNTLASQGTGLKVNLLSNVCFTYYENIIALFSSGAQRCRM